MSFGSKVNHLVLFSISIIRSFPILCPLDSEFGSERNHLGHQVLLIQSTKLWNKEKKKMNKKLLLGLLSIALVAAVGIPAMMETWNSCTITMHASSGESAGIGQFTDCLTTTPLTTFNWGALAQNQHYEMPVYVKNTGNQAVKLYFYAYPTSANAWIPTISGGVYPGDCNIYFNNQQVKFNIRMFAITNYGLPCELGDPQYNPPIAEVPCKFVNGFITTQNSNVCLLPGKVQKFDVVLTTYTLVNGASYDWTFTIDGITT